MVSYMADKLKQNGKNLNDYYEDGVIPLFSDYINWYKTQKNYSPELKFESSFEQQIAKWNTDWAKTWNDKRGNWRYLLQLISKQSVRV